MHMSNLAVKVTGAWPVTGSNMDVPANELICSAQTSKAEYGVDSFAFADIYLRGAPCFLKGMMLQARGEDVKGTLRKPDAGVLAFENGACELTATQMFLTVAMSAADEAGLADMQAYFEEKLRTLSPQTNIEIEWRNK